jgi:hypothetical protein
MPKTLDSNVLEAGREEAHRVLKGVRETVRQAVTEHKHAGRAIPTVQDGKVVWIPADEIDLPESED